MRTLVVIHGAALRASTYVPPALRGDCAAQTSKSDLETEILHLATHRFNPARQHNGVFLHLALKVVRCPRTLALSHGVVGHCTQEQRWNNSVMPFLSYCCALSQSFRTRWSR